VSFALLILIVIVLLQVKRSMALFVLEISSGQLRVKRGSLSASLRRDFSQAVRRIENGSIRGYSSAEGIRLAFSGAIDPSTAQRLRNILGIHQR